jgi:hypothetical protein
MNFAVPMGSLLTFSITSTTTASKTAAQVLAEVADELNGGGSLNVRSSKILTGLTTGIVDMIAGLTPKIPFQAEITVQTSVGFASPDDPLSIVNHAFYDSVGELPSTYSVTGIQRPGEAAPSSTGQPGASAGGAGGSEGPVSSIADAISNFFSGLKTTTISIIIGLVAIVILVLLLVAYGPNVGSIARAAA